MERDKQFALRIKLLSIYKKSILKNCERHNIFEYKWMIIESTDTFLQHYKKYNYISLLFSISKEN